MKQLFFLLYGFSLTAFAADHHGHNHSHHGHDHDHEEHHHGAAEQIEILTAGAGVVERFALFPAEVKLNRDRATAVTPAYAGVIKSMNVQLGDAVNAGDVIAEIENRETLTVYKLTSPLTGVVIARSGTAGETAGGETALYEIADLSTVWVDVHIFPQHRAAVKSGQHVELMSGETVCAAIEYISPLIDPETRTLIARCVVPSAAFQPGAFAKARIAVESVNAAVTVEKEAVQTIDGHTVVFVPSAGGAFEPRDVVTGVTGAEHVEIKSGLSAGEKYAGHGAFNLKAEIVIDGLDPHAGHGH